MMVIAACSPPLDSRSRPSESGHTETRALWVAVAALALLQVVAWLRAPTLSNAAPESGGHDAKVAEFEQRVEAIAAKFERATGASSSEPGAERSTVTHNDAGARLTDLERRIERIEKALAEEDERGAEAARALAEILGALSAGDLDAPRRLVEAGLDVNARGPDGRTPAIAAAESGSVELFDMLLAKGAHLELADGRGRTPLLVAIDSDHDDLACALLDRGSHAGAVDRNGESAVIWAAFTGSENALKKLIAMGADLDKQSHDGNSALADAVRKKRTHIVRLLLEHGANVHITDKAGRTPLDLALSRDADEIVALIQAYGGKRGRER